MAGLLRGFSLKYKIMKAKNLKEFKALIKRYESITLEEIKEEQKKHDYFIGDTIANKLTGYGEEETCTLCKNIDMFDDCKGCIYTDVTNAVCGTGINKKTYDRIYGADTPRKLLNAFRARAKHMKVLFFSKTLLKS